MDKLTRERRSANMRRIRSVGMKPEMSVRRLVHKLGFRYRLHYRGLPGKADLVFVSRRKIIFVHGCYWHQHQGCREGRPPNSNRGYWLPKLARNVERDAAAIAALQADGWLTLTIWECETVNPETVKDRLLTFLA